MPQAGDLPAKPLRTWRPMAAWSALGLALLATSWIVSGVGGYRANRMAMSRFGACEDVPEALARDGYVARQVLPYIVAAIVLDGLALLALMRPLADMVLRRGWFRSMGVAIGVFWLLKVGLDLLSLLANTFFAGGSAP